MIGPVAISNMCSTWGGLGRSVSGVTPPRTTPVEPDPALVYEQVVARIAEVQGIINIAEAELVSLVRQGIEVGVSGGTALSVQAWVAWRTGVAPERAYSITRLAERADELPSTIAALDAGELTVDQAGEIARNVPGRYEASASRVARHATVKQLRRTLPSYRDRKPTDGSPTTERRSVSTGVDEHGWWARLRLPEAEGAIVDQALTATYDDLRRQARSDTPDGQTPEPVTRADALVALAETALRAGQAARPPTERYLVHLHLEAGPHGPQLMTHLGIALPDDQRRRLLCDPTIRAIHHDPDTGTPLSVGRKTRHINRRLRRAIEHRDRGCTAPGCGRTTGLEIHHIRHWEHGGPTDTANLLTLCRYHHKAHHDGTLGIQGNADLPRHHAPGVVFTNQWGRTLDPTGRPVTPASRADGETRPNHLHQAATTTGIRAHTYTPPAGERLNPRDFYLIDQDPPPPGDEGTNDPAEPEPDPDATGRAPRSDAGPTGPDGPTTTDPTRAGPTRA